MKANRREFISATAAIGAGASLGVIFGGYETEALARVPDPNDPNDPNAITDPDHEIGKPYCGWKEGELDLHFINTGCSENCFHIFPDGTTMLLDAGDWNIASYKERMPPRPDDSRRPGEWVARYISRVKPGLETIDYVMASHFHSDHTGAAGENSGLKMKGLDPNEFEDYMISGISHVGEYYRFGTAYDRGYPNYDKPTDWAPKERENLRRFWDYKEKTDGLKREEFVVGALDQIKQLKSPDKYDFHIRNICCNGVLWGGEEGENLDYFEKWPKNKETNKNENTRSICLVMEYGPFRFYTGGDASGVLLDENEKDVDFEGALGRRVGPVDVCKSNHHSFRDAMRKSFCNAVQARAYVTCVWDRWHLQSNTSAAMCDSSDKGYPGPRVVCPTGIHPANGDILQDKPWRKYVVERGGHVVVKAYDGGKKYKVYYLTDKDESMNVELVFGPFDAKRA